MTFDYVIVGAGTAGCVLADRLSADRKSRVLLLEAGPIDSNPLIGMPKGVAKLLGLDVKETWALPAKGDVGAPDEIWWRGRTLGGSSSINGAVYLRGHAEDYDDWERAGAEGWGWSQIRRAFEAFEDHPLGAGVGRGTGGPLRISLTPRSELSERLISAAEKLGIPRVEDTGHPNQFGVGYIANTIYKGTRQSAATAFLRPAAKRPNLKVRTNVKIDRVIFENRRAVGVISTDGETILTDGEVILASGALASPQILQRSGIGPARLLSNLGIPIIVDSVGVGQHMREYRLLNQQYRLNRRLSVNRGLSGSGVLMSALRYFLFKSGPLAAGACDLTAFIQTKSDLPRPDAQILMAPFGYSIDANGQPQIADEETFHLFGHPLVCRSEGSANILSANPNEDGELIANYFADEFDRVTSIALFRFIRKWMAQSPIAEVVSGEISPGPTVESDDEIIDAFKRFGHCGLHASGTVRMGASSSEPVDPNLRVRGVQGLRVVDASILPTPVSSNPNGPIMAVAWRGAEIITETANA